jgi:cytochrome c oxidase subunit II
VLVTGAAGCGDRFGAPEPASEQGEDVLDLWRALMWLAIGVAALVLVLLVVVLLRHRREPPDPDELGVPEPGEARRDDVRVELGWTAFAVVLVAVAFALTMRVEARAQDADPELTVHVEGYQWQWRFAYPDGPVVEGTPDAPPTLVLPVGVPVELLLDSPDVVHSFFVPELLVKLDVVPGRTNRLVVTPSRVGTFRGVCAEFCALDHYRMTFELRVVEPEEFDAWLLAQPVGEPGQIVDRPVDEGAEAAS